ncbi:MAG: hypothetical protein M3421_13765, partial [Bacteroidota bacterium]|nr:hypothetical protein [Bacteroidota bacterium]
METEIKNWEVIAKYLKGELSEKERHELTIWVQSKPENKLIFEQVKNLWFASETEDHLEINVDRSWERFKKSAVSSEKGPAIQDEVKVEKQVKRIYLPLLFRVAAVFVICLSIVYLFFREGSQEDLIVHTSVENQLKEVVLPDGSTVILNKKSKVSFAQDF